MRWRCGFSRSLPWFAGLCLAAGCGHRPTPAVQEAVDFEDQPDLFSHPLHGSAAEALAPVAMVDGKAITRAELRRETQLMAVTLRQRLNPEQYEAVAPRLQQEALRGIIIRRLLAGAVETENIAVDPGLVRERLADIRAAVEKGRTWDDFLSSGNLTEEQLRDHLTASMRVDALIQSRVRDVAEPTEEEIQAYYREQPDQFLRPEAVQLRHLFLKVDAEAGPDAWDRARTKADSLLEAAREAGADFDALVAEHSDDADTRDRGGLLGTFPRGKILPELESAAFAAEVGEVVGPVQTKLGVHLLRVDAHENARQFSFEEARDTARARLVQQRKQEAFQRYLADLIDEADVVIPAPADGASSPAPDGQ